MSGPAGSPSPGPPPRPWWVALLGVGSIGFGGIQALAGIAVVAWGLLLGPPASGVLAWSGVAWLVPGLLLAVSGVGVTVRARWGRAASLAAAACCLLGVGLVTAHRERVPPAMADGIEFLAEHPDAKGSPAGDLLRRMRADPKGDPVRSFRDPSLRSIHGWTMAAYCCCPAAPWYLLVLLACAGPWARGMGRERNG